MIAEERLWVQLILKGDSRGFEQFYGAYGDRIYRLCYRFSGSHSEAEDLAQEVFIAAYRALGRFEHRSSLSTWLYRIALDCWRASLRKKEMDKRTEASNWDRDPGSKMDLAQHLVDKVTLDAAVESLPNDLKEALILVKSEGLKYREAAAVLGVPQGTIQFRVHEAIMRIRATTSGDKPLESPEARARHSMEGKTDVL